MQNISNDVRKNSEQYHDPTAGAAITNMTEEEERFHKLLHTIFYLCNLAGFSVDGRITFIDKRTGRVWR